MNKQRAIDELGNAIPDFILDDFQRGKEAGLICVLKLVKQLNDPRKPVVPQFVVDWRGKYKSDFKYNSCRLCIDFHGRKLHENLHEWFKFDKNRPIETFTLMRKFGHEVEREKLYTVELPNPNSLEYFVPRKNGVNKITADRCLSDNWELYKNT